MRGKGHFGTAYSVNPRITPAYAGKSAAFVKSFGTARDHPRLCGEKGFGLFPQPLHTGSPPPMRGKDTVILSGDYSERITPAYAGKSPKPRY